jgi:hypothetical protein
MLNVVNLCLQNSAEWFSKDFMYQETVTHPKGFLSHNRYKNNTKICRFAIVEFMQILLYRSYSHWLLLVTLQCGSY